MNIALQVWGGIFYLFNKILLSRAQGREDDRKLRASAWIWYLIGMPAWVTIFVLKHNWIAAAIEAGGAPAMLLGVVLALTTQEENRNVLTLKRVAAAFTYGLLVFGVGYSLYEFGGITKPTQVLEISMISGFLVGTYLLARKDPRGYLWFMLMILSNLMLMAVQGKPILVVQQAVSLGFVLRGFARSRAKV